MDYILEFDIAAFILECLVIIFYYSRKNITIVQNKLYILIAHVVMLVTFLEFFTTFINIKQISIPRPLVAILHCIYLCGTTGLPLLFLFYCFSLVDFWNKKSEKFVLTFSHILLLPYLFCLIIIWLSPFFGRKNPLAFYLDQNNMYVRGDFWFVMLYAASATYFVVTFCIFVIYRKLLSTEKKLIMLFYLVIIVTCVLVQFFIPKALVECFGMSISLLAFFFIVQRPDDNIDSHTKGFNQNAFVKLYSIGKSGKKKYTCVSLIIDDTVFIANTFGIHQMYNFLRAVSDFLVENFNYENVFRISQNCFIIVINNDEPGQIYEIIGKIQTRFKGNWNCDSIEIKLYKRICVIECPKDAVNPEEVIELVNLVTNDERYKQSVVFAKDIDIEYKRKTTYIEHALRSGFSHNRFDVFYQPIFSVEDNRLIGAEALVRLQDENGKYISPEDFIPISEKNGSILKIGEFVFESVCRTLSKLDLEEYGIKKIDINLSVAQCMQEILADHLLSVQNLFNIPSSVINLEITETAAAHTPDILLKNIKNLSEAGIELSLDDYGSGYSNMNYMLNMPFRMIKIDKYIVWSAFENERSKKALIATITMIKSLGMTVLAEGVETKNQADWLIEQGCDYLQGFYYSKPVEVSEFLTLMKKQKTL